MNMLPIEYYIETQVVSKAFTKTERLQRTICKEFGIPLEQFHSKSRRGMTPTARYVYYYLAWEYGLFTTITEIGESIGRQHTNASVGITKIEDLVKVDYNFKRRLRRIDKKLNS
jgi:chromosomal replication initiation ATPase DnaA